MEILRELKKLALFKGCPDQDLTRMTNCFKAEITSYGKGEVIINQSSDAGRVYLILKGEANVEHEDMFGNIAIILNLKAGDFFGLEEAYADKSTYKDALVSAEKSVVASFDRAKIISPCSNNCPCHQLLAKDMMKMSSARSLALTDKIKHLSQRGIKDKVLSYLETQSRIASSSYFEIPFNKTELASYLAVERSALSTVLGKLKKEGVIDFDKKRYHLKIKNQEE